MKVIIKKELVHESLFQDLIDLGYTENELNQKFTSYFYENEKQFNHSGSIDLFKSDLSKYKIDMYQNKKILIEKLKR